MKELIFKILIFASAILILLSCESGSSTKYEEKLSLYCYARADSTIDSLYLFRTAAVNEAINRTNLGVSNADIRLYEKGPEDQEYSLAGTLAEYSENEGIYFMPEAENFGKFTTGYSYRIEASHAELGLISTETVCPPPLGSVIVKNAVTDSVIASMYDDPAAVDTLYYKRGSSFDDIKLLTCSFDSLSLLFADRMASYRIVPDELCKTDTSFWLEDTTATVWDEYPIETRIFKNKEGYGMNFTGFNIRSISIFWYSFYHSGMHTLIISATDEAFKNFMESRYGGEERFSNVEGGVGLFTISNSSGPTSRYRFYIKSQEYKYP